ncbi:hypothetical protein EVG20_g11706 [Dentipellis fragilis]|uniref:Uncharacterized protein n=1 Tax=Dentipellis fragilis TaxID=205917 RepID=A0A4Y9XJM1_9AGAM|nr:hypothetical protein EVG20_g11706 [Dentipellis fragilis]
MADLVVSLSGVVDGVAVPADVVRSSAILRHLHAYMRQNADQLGLNTVSDVYADGPHDIPKFTLTPSRPLQADASPPVTLLSIHLVYVWEQQSTSRSPSFAPLFSSQLLLPISSILDDAVEKLLCTQFVRRYPLIFGSWRMRLELELDLLLPLGNALSNVIRRSRDADFRSACNRIIEGIRSKNNVRHTASSAALGACFSLEVSTAILSTLDPIAHVSDCMTISNSLRHVYRASVFPSRFKVTPIVLSSDYMDIC